VRRILCLLLPLLLLGPGAAAVAKKQHARPSKSSSGLTARPSSAQREALAQAYYDWLWKKKGSRFFGAQGQPSPNLTFATPSAGGSEEVGANAAGMRQVVLGPDAIGLANLRRPHPWRYLRRDLLHEWAHVFQRPELYGEGRNLPHDQQPMEAAAMGFANDAVQRLARKETLRRMARHQNPRLGKMKRRYRANRLASLDRSQFGSNYGANPRTIPWPL
jgi:hypothetical protein